MNSDGEVIGEVGGEGAGDSVNGGAVHLLYIIDFMSGKKFKSSGIVKLWSYNQ